MRQSKHTRVGLALVLLLATTSWGPAEQSGGSSAEQDKRVRFFLAPPRPLDLHGSGLVTVRALPGNQELSSTTENTVTASTDLGFAVTIEDTGDSQEVQVKVTLTVQQSPSPIVRTKTLDLINPGQQKTLVFRNLGQVQFATRTPVKVDIQPVPEEKNVSDNSAVYPVIFSLG